MADVTWKLNGLDLDEDLGGYLGAVTVWRPAVSVRGTTIVIPGQHGARRPGLPVYEEPQVTIQLVRDEVETQSDLEEKVNQASALLAQPSLTVTRVSGDLETSAVASLVSIAADGFIPGRAGSATALLAVPGVFFRRPVWTSPDLAFAGDVTSVELAGLSGSTAPIPDAVIRITGPRTNPYVTDPSTGTGIFWQGTVAAGQHLFLCPKPLSARLSANAADWLSGGTDVSGAVSFPAAGRLQMWPVVQTATTRKVLVSATGTGGTAASKLAVRAQGSHL